MRIVSLLPSATDIVYALGLGDRLVGVSHCCDYPSPVSNLPKMTRTVIDYAAPSQQIDRQVRSHLAQSSALYDLDMQALANARPDVIVSQDLCDVCAVSSGDVLAALSSLPSKPVLVDLRPNTMSDVLDDIQRVGDATSTPTKAAEIVADMRARMQRVASRSEKIPTALRPRVAMLDWLLPPIAAGHWNPELLELAGAVDILDRHARPSVSMPFTEIEKRRPDVTFVACCGFSVQRTRQDLALLDANPEWRRIVEAIEEKILIADGNHYFSRPGPRLVDGLEMLAHALHPDIHPRSAFGSCEWVGDCSQVTSNDARVVKAPGM